MTGYDWNEVPLNIFKKQHVISVQQNLFFDFFTLLHQTLIKFCLSTRQQEKNDFTPVAKRIFLTNCVSKAASYLMVTEVTALYFDVAFGASDLQKNPTEL